MVSRSGGLGDGGGRRMPAGLVVLWADTQLKSALPQSLASRSR
jgi:hypothetical protein